MGLTSRRVLAMAAGMRRQLGAAIVLSVGVAATKLAQAVLIAHLLVDAFADAFGRRRSPSPLVLVVLAALVGVRLVLAQAQDVRAAATTSAFRRQLRGRLYRHLTILGPAYSLRHRTGEIQATLGDGVDALGTYIGRFIPLLVAATVTVVGVVAVAVVVDPVAGGALAIAALLVPAAPMLTEGAFGETGRNFWVGFGRLSAGYLDAIQGMTTLRASNAEARWGQRLHDESQELCDDAVGLNALASMHVGFVALGMAAGTGGVAALAALRVTQGALGLAGALTILLLARECFAPLAEVSAALPAAYRAASAATAVIELLEAGPEVVAAAAAAPASVPAAVTPRPLAPSIVFEDVTFRYRSGDRPALDGLSFRVDEGETVALVGRSGAGKSTVVSLLLRHFDPERGSIRVGGRDIADIPVADLRELFAVTFQDTYLFHRSVRENLLLGRPGASDGDVEAAARAAHAHAFIREMPEGYDTLVGERGTRLSGGERQRLAIARAVLADRPILVLDEPTSSVDAASESLIRHALDELTACRTTLVIAHRLSTIERAGRVVVLDAGRVIEAGPPADLLSAPGAYRRLVDAQDLA